VLFPVFVCLNPLLKVVSANRKAERSNQNSIHPTVLFNSAADMNRINQSLDTFG
jgi:hypothetical protein